MGILYIMKAALPLFFVSSLLLSSWAFSQNTEPSIHIEPEMKLFPDAQGGSAPAPVGTDAQGDLMRQVAAATQDNPDIRNALDPAAQAQIAQAEQQMAQENQAQQEGQEISLFDKSADGRPLKNRTGKTVTNQGAQQKANADANVISAAGKIIEENPDLKAAIDPAALARIQEANTPKETDNPQAEVTLFPANSNPPQNAVLPQPSQGGNNGQTLAPFPSRVTLAP